MNKTFNLWMIASFTIITLTGCGGSDAGPADSSFNSERSVPLVSSSGQPVGGLYHLHEAFSNLDCSDGRTVLSSGLKTSVYAVSSDDTDYESNRPSGDNLILMKYLDPLLTTIELIENGTYTTSYLSGISQADYEFLESYLPNQGPYTIATLQEAEFVDSIPNTFELLRTTNGRTFSGSNPLSNTDSRDSNIYELDVEFDGDDQLVGTHEFEAFASGTNFSCSGQNDIFAQLDGSSEWLEYRNKILSTLSEIEHAATSTSTVMSLTTTTNIPIVAQISLPVTTAVVTEIVATFPETIIRTVATTSSAPVEWFIEDFRQNLSGYNVFIYDQNLTLLNAGNTELNPVISTSVTITEEPFTVIFEPSVYFYPDNYPDGFPFVNTAETSIEFTSTLPHIIGPVTSVGPTPPASSTTTTTLTITP